MAQLGFLPPAPLEESKRSALMENAVEELEWFLFAERWRGAIFRPGGREVCGERT